MNEAQIKKTQEFIDYLKECYKPSCATRDVDDFPDLDKSLNAESRCIACTVDEVIIWLNKHIELLEWELEQ